MDQPRSYRSYTLSLFFANNCGDAQTVTNQQPTIWHHHHSVTFVGCPSIRTGEYDKGMQYQESLQLLLKHWFHPSISVVFLSGGQKPKTSIEKESSRRKESFKAVFATQKLECLHPTRNYPYYRDQESSGSSNIAARHSGSDWTMQEFAVQTTQPSQRPWEGQQHAMVCRGSGIYDQGCNTFEQEP